MKHIFITGERDAGKTTLINRFVTDAGLRAAGFNTVVGNVADAYLGSAKDAQLGDTNTEIAKKHERGNNSDSDAQLEITDCIYIVPYGESSDSAQRPVAIRNRSRMSYTAYPEVFDVRGTEILSDAKILTDDDEADLIIMDELGFMEADAHDFQHAVLSCLDGSVPILGVIKPKRTPFLDAVREHANVLVFEVTPDTRTQVLALVKTEFQKNFPKCCM